LDSEALISLATQVSASEFSALYERYTPYVHAILIAKLPLDYVEDTLQDVFADAWRKIGQLHSLDAFPQWVAAIARNKAADFYRRRIRSVGLEEVREASVPPRQDPILTALAQLPEAYQETLALRFVEGLTGPEIAALTGLTHGSVRVNLARGVKMLRELMGVEV
jgi:RNA polymerase sigma-70 factor (ECF subfamily)